MEAQRAYAVQLQVDAETEAQVKDVWRRMAEAGLSTYLHESSATPHVTLGIHDDMDVETAQDRLTALASRTPAFAFRFNSIGIFGQDACVVFLAPVMTQSLWTLHRAVHAALEDCASPSWEHYCEPRWVPHCTLAMDLEPEHLPAAINHARTFALPHDGVFEAFGIIEFRPVRHVFSKNLQRPN
ncbi:MAG: 2'-5' RNA ligase family protein [Candidatus Hydrogenedentes bacterium]|nr:2'-5' RNA ligase family protein [Candidatus Hydrogenedentota bacterium]